jgi:hypothetical protein
MTEFKHASKALQSLVNHMIKNSIEFCMDMRQDEDLEEENKYTLRQIRDQVIWQASDLFAQELDVPVAPDLIQGYIKEIVDAMNIGVVMGYIEAK